MGLRRYRELLSIPGVPRLLIAAWVGRLPYGMNIVALILLLRAQGFDYAAVGIVTGASGLGIGATAPVLGRLIDRLGQTRVLVTTACLWLAGGAAVTAGALAGAGVLALTVLAAVQGASAPPVSSSLRTLLPSLVGRERIDTAFAFDALQLELVFILGPLLAATIAAVFSPEAAFVTSVVMQSAGALGVAAMPASRAWRPVVREPGATRAGPLSIPGIRTLLLTFAVTAVALGALEIGIAAFAEREATRSDAGWLFAIWAAGSFAGGLWYGARQWRSGADRRFLTTSAVLALGLAPLPLAWSMPVFAVLVVVAGLGLAPSTAASYSLIGELAPEGAVTEAYAWQIVAYVSGGAAGAWLAGVLVEHAGVAAALACAPVAAALGLLVAVTRRRSLAPA
jgi:MFS family permease